MLRVSSPTERDIAKLMTDFGFISTTHFSRAFHNVLDMTPHRYVMWRRVLRAKQLIRESQAGLADIARLTGFADQSHLGRFFHFFIGESPGRFRQRYR